MLTVGFPPAPENPQMQKEPRPPVVGTDGRVCMTRSENNDAETLKRFADAEIAGGAAVCCLSPDE